MSTAPQPILTASEFFEWEAGQLEKHEFYYGEVFSMAGGTPEHALITANAIGHLGAQLAGGPCRAYSSDLAVELDPNGHFSYPDATVVYGAVERSVHGLAATNPAVVVEVLSPTTAGWDRGGKAEAYRRIGSLQAIVYIATDRPHVDALVREGERWMVAEPDADGRLALDAVGATLRVDALYDGVDLDATASGRPSG